MSDNVRNCPLSSDPQSAFSTQDSAPSTQDSALSTPPATPMSDNVRNCPPSDDPQSSLNVLSAPQLSAIDLLLAGQTDRSIAATLGISPRTLYRWRTRPGPIRDLLEQRRRDLFDSAGDRLRTLLSSALDTFDKQLRDPYAPTSLRAARVLLSLASLARSLKPAGPATDPAAAPQPEAPADPKP